ncbi:MAG: adenine phosphoribosyltransferase [Candidatus Aminicenantes bacterium]|nr:adenine phosphoribosyltransferase [Candidatus Aminicenantes bacterium]
MLDRLKDIVVEVKDFPKSGIGFKDITPLIENAESFNFVIETLVGWAQAKNPQIVAGIEARGFLFAAPVAHRLNLGVAVIRKKGKLPRETFCVKAPNEYAVEYFEMHCDSVKKDQRVVIIDDLIATGSSSVSAIDLVKKTGGKVVGFAAVIELLFLNGVDFIKKHHPEIDIHTIIQYQE